MEERHVTLTAAPCSARSTRLLWSAALVGVTLLSPRAAPAQEGDDAGLDRRSGPSLYLRAGLGWLHQQGHAPPVCCGERDSWVALGPTAGLGVAWQFGRWFRIAADGRYAFLRTDEAGLMENATVTLHHVQVNLVPELVVPLAARFALRVGIGAGWDALVGAGGEGPEAEDVDESWFNVLARIGLEVAVDRSLDLGVDLQAGLIPITLDYGATTATATWRF